MCRPFLVAALQDDGGESTPHFVTNGKKMMMPNVLTHNVLTHMFCGVRMTI